MEISCCKIVPPFQGLEIRWIVTQGVARRLALPWAIMLRAFSPRSSCSLLSKKTRTTCFVSSSNPKHKMNTALPTLSPSNAEATPFDDGALYDLLFENLTFGLADPLRLRLGWKNC